MTIMATPKMLLEPRKHSIGPHRARAERSASRDESVEERVYRGRSVGNSLDAAVTSGRSRRVFTRVNNEARARRLLDQKLEYVYDPDFDRPDAGARICVPAPAGSGDGTPLRPEEEAHLFLKMNYLKYRACKLREMLDPASALASELDEIERLQGLALAVKHLIVQSSLRLVVSIARKWVGPDRGLLDLVSEGNLSLIRAAEKFDVSRGFKFSTYASNAIIRNLSRTTTREINRRCRFVTGHGSFLEAAAARQTDEPASDDFGPGTQEVMRRMLARLNDRERWIIVSRFGLDGDRQKSRNQLGTELGITTERVRQIELRAREKLREFALEQGLDPTAA
jgi:RNA polymerase primary sigma factor